MATFWNNCKLGVKLQAAFGLVMLLFVAAIVAIFVLNAKVEALSHLQVTTIIPARSAANRLAAFAATADDHGAYYLMATRPAEAARRLAQYRFDISLISSEIGRCEQLCK